jgi:hypothetical protein
VQFGEHWLSETAEAEYDEVLYRMTTFQCARRCVTKTAAEKQEKSDAIFGSLVRICQSLVID